MTPTTSPTHPTSHFPRNPTLQSHSQALSPAPTPFHAPALALAPIAAPDAAGHSAVLHGTRLPLRHRLPVSTVPDLLADDDGPEQGASPGRACSRTRTAGKGACRSAQPPNVAVAREEEGPGATSSDADRENDVEREGAGAAAVGCEAGGEEGHAPSRRFQIMVRTLPGRTITLDVSVAQTIGEVKAKIRDKDGTSPLGARVVYAGKQLDGDHSLNEYGVGRDATLHILLRLCGGSSTGQGAPGPSTPRISTGTAAANPLDRPTLHTPVAVRPADIPYTPFASLQIPSPPMPPRRARQAPPVSPTGDLRASPLFTNPPTLPLSSARTPPATTSADASRARARRQTPTSTYPPPPTALSIPPSSRPARQEQSRRLYDGRLFSPERPSPHETRATSETAGTRDPAGRGGEPSAANGGDAVARPVRACQVTDERERTHSHAQATVPDATPTTPGSSSAADASRHLVPAPPPAAATPSVAAAAHATPAPRRASAHPPPSPSEPSLAKKQRVDTPSEAIAVDVDRAPAPVPLPSEPEAREAGGAQRKKREIGAEAPQAGRPTSGVGEQLGSPSGPSSAVSSPAPPRSTSSDALPARIDAPVAGTPPPGPPVDQPAAAPPAPTLAAPPRAYLCGVRQILTSSPLEKAYELDTLKRLAEAYECWGDMAFASPREVALFLAQAQRTVLENDKGGENPKPAPDAAYTFAAEYDGSLQYCRDVAEKFGIELDETRAMYAFGWTPREIGHSVFGPGENGKGPTAQYVRALFETIVVLFRIVCIFVDAEAFAPTREEHIQLKAQGSAGNASDWSMAASARDARLYESVLNAILRYERRKVVAAAIFGNVPAFYMRISELGFAVPDPTRCGLDAFRHVPYALSAHPRSAVYDGKGRHGGKGKKEAKEFTSRSLYAMVKEITDLLRHRGVASPSAEQVWTTFARAYGEGDLLKADKLFEKVCGDAVDPDDPDFQAYEISPFDQRPAAVFHEASKGGCGAHVVVARTYTKGTVGLHPANVPRKCPGCGRKLERTNTRIVNPARVVFAGDE